jgi:hypothetical protein
MAFPVMLIPVAINLGVQVISMITGKAKERKEAKLASFNSWVQSPSGQLAMEQGANYYSKILMERYLSRMGVAKKYQLRLDILPILEAMTEERPYWEVPTGELTQTVGNIPVSAGTNQKVRQSSDQWQELALRPDADPDELRRLAPWLDPLNNRYDPNAPIPVAWEEAIEEAADDPGALGDRPRTGRIIGMVAGGLALGAGTAYAVKKLGERKK